MENQSQPHLRWIAKTPILRFRTNSTFLLVAGALIGFLRHHWFEIGRVF